MDWNYKEGRQQHYIGSWSEFGGLYNRDKWSQTQEDLVDRKYRLEKVLNPYLMKMECELRGHNETTKEFITIGAWRSGASFRQESDLTA